MYLNHVGGWFSETLVSHRQTLIYVMCPWDHKIWSLLFTTPSELAPNHVRKCLCKVRTFKIQSHSLNKLRRILFKIFWREILLNSPNELCIKIWGCDGGVREQGAPRPKIMWCRFFSQTHWYEKDNEISSSHCKFFQLVFLELNTYTLSPSNIKRPTLLHQLDSMIIRTPHFT